MTSSVSSKRKGERWHCPCLLKVSFTLSNVITTFCTRLSLTPAASEHSPCKISCPDLPCLAVVHQDMGMMRIWSKGAGRAPLASRIAPAWV